MTIGTMQSRWMQYCEQEIIAALLIHKFFNRENDHGIRLPFPTSYSRKRGRCIQKNRDEQKIYDFTPKHT
jgi:hypothetical protein